MTITAGGNNTRMHEAEKGFVAGSSLLRKVALEESAPPRAPACEKLKGNRGPPVLFAPRRH
jgi:hypothetical protein